jgi:hypothetical protein
LKVQNPKDVAKRIIEGIVLKEDEIYVPELTRHLITIVKLLPTFLKDKLYFLFCNIIFLFINFFS